MTLSDSQPRRGGWKMAGVRETGWRDVLSRLNEERVVDSWSSKRPMQNQFLDPQLFALALPAALAGSFGWAWERRVGRGLPVNSGWHCQVVGVDRGVVDGDVVFAFRRSTPSGQRQSRNE